MAVYSGPEIVNSGLVLHLDAANSRSYPGSGTTWYDLTKNAKNAAFVNSPSFSSSNAQSSFTDFSTNQYLVTGDAYNGTSLPTGTSPRTLMVGFLTPPTISGYQHIVHYGTNTTGQSFGMAIYQGLLNNHTWAGNSNFSNKTITPNTKYIAAVKFNNSSTPKNKFFINGEFGVTGYGQGMTTDYAINTGTAYQLHIGSRIQSPYELLGSGGKVFFCFNL